MSELGDLIIQEDVLRYNMGGNHFNVVSGRFLRALEGQDYEKDVKQESTHRIIEELGSRGALAAVYAVRHEVQPDVFEDSEDVVMVAMRWYRNTKIAHHFIRPLSTQLVIREATPRFEVHPLASQFEWPQS